MMGWWSMLCIYLAHSSEVVGSGNEAKNRGDHTFPLLGRSQRLVWVKLISRIITSTIKDLKVNVFCVEHFILITLAFYFDNISMVGMFDECKVTSPLCALDGMSLALIGWDQVMITAAWQQCAGREGRSALRTKIVKSVKAGECCTTQELERPSHQVPVWGQAFQCKLQGIHWETVGETLWVILAFRSRLLPYPMYLEM